MVVLSAYLAVFDWNLIWLIEYGDLTKMCLIGAALISSSTMTIIYQAQDIYSWVVKKSSRWKTTVLVGVGIGVVLTGIQIYFDVRSDSDLFYYHLFRQASLLILLLLVYTGFRDYEHWLNGNWIAISNQIAVLTFFLGTAGAAYGYYVKDVSTYSREILTVDGKYPDAKIIMFLSHHVAFMSGKSVIVVPTSEIKRILSTSTTLQIPVMH